MPAIEAQGVVRLGDVGDLVGLSRFVVPYAVRQDVLEAEFAELVADAAGRSDTVGRHADDIEVVVEVAGL